MFKKQTTLNVLSVNNIQQCDKDSHLVLRHVFVWFFKIVRSAMNIVLPRY